MYSCKYWMVSPCIDTTLRTAAVTYFLTGAVGLFLHAANPIGVVKPVSLNPGATKA